MATVFHLTSHVHYQYLHNLGPLCSAEALALDYLIQSSLHFEKGYAYSINSFTYQHAAKDTTIAAQAGSTSKNHTTQ